MHGLHVRTNSFERGVYRTVRGLVSRRVPRINSGCAIAQYRMFACSIAYKYVYLSVWMTVHETNEQTACSSSPTVYRAYCKTPLAGVPISNHCVRYGYVPSRNKTKQLTRLRVRTTCCYYYYTLYVPNAPHFRSMGRYTLATYSRNELRLTKRNETKANYQPCITDRIKSKSNFIVVVSLLPGSSSRGRRRRCCVVRQGIDAIAIQRRRQPHRRRGRRFKLKFCGW